MTKRKADLEHKIIGEDLCKLGLLLVQKGLCSDTGPLDAAGNNCTKEATEDEWSYNFNNLKFEIKSVSNTIPAYSTDIKLLFSINITGISQDSELLVNNPLANLSFNIEIIGDGFDSQENVIQLHCAWHLDKHIRKKGDGENKYSHPEYHFTFGGEKMEKKGNIYGATLIFPSPRFSYPPMDAVLGINFILQNYFHKEEIKNLLEDPLYKNLVKKSQERLWLPYAKSFYSYWEDLNCKFEEDFIHKAIFPLLA